MARDVRWRRLLAGGLAAVVALIGWDGALAVLAQRAGTAFAGQNDYPFGGYSLAGHLTAVVALAVVTVVVATALARSRSWVLGVLVLAGIAAGPLAVTAAPLSASQVTNSDGIVAWWHLVTQGPQFLVMLAATVWSLRALPEPAIGVPERREAAVFAVTAAAAVTFQVVTVADVHQHPSLLVMTGWAVLAAGFAVLLRRPGPGWVPAAAWSGGALPLALMFLAYDRRGGWPGVAGWETFAQSPIVLAVATPVVLLAVPGVAVVRQVLARRAPHRARAEPRSAEV